MTILGRASLPSSYRPGDVRRSGVSTALATDRVTKGAGVVVARELGPQRPQRAGASI